MIEIQKAIIEKSRNYLRRLEEEQRLFEARILSFLSSDIQKCVVLQTPDTMMAAIRIKTILKSMDENASSKYGNPEDRHFLTWTSLLQSMDSSKVLPKFSNLLVLELSPSEPNFDQVDILELIMERINMVPIKKAILIFAHQQCPDTFLRGVDLNAFIIIDEFNNRISSIDDTEPEQLLYEAVCSARAKHVSDLIDKCDLNKTIDENGTTLLHGAALQGDKNVVQMLLHAGAVLTANNAGQTPLHIAADYGNNEAVMTILNLASSAEINVQDDRGRTALHLAAELGHYDVVVTLLKLGADINCKDLDDYTPLQYAVESNNQQIVKFLIGKRADRENRNRWDKTAMDIARSNGCDEIVELLMTSSRQSTSRLSVNLSMI